MHNKVLKTFIFLTLIFALSVPVFAASSSSSTAAEAYTEDEFPQWAKELRHAEIITFGSMPFVSIGVTMIYGSYLYYRGDITSFPNPLNKTSSSFTSDQTKMIFGITMGVSAGLGVTDWAINFIKRQNKDRRQKLLEASSELPSAVPLTREEAKQMLESESDESYSSESESEEVLSGQETAENPAGTAAEAQ